MCQFIKWVAADAAQDLPFTQFHMPQLRLQMVHELMNSKVHLTWDRAKDTFMARQRLALALMMKVHGVMVPYDLVEQVGEILK
jgi:hypothetical protein